MPKRKPQSQKELILAKFGGTEQQFYAKYGTEQDYIMAMGGTPKMYPQIQSERGFFSPAYQNVPAPYQGGSFAYGGMPKYQETGQVQQEQGQGQEQQMQQVMKQVQQMLKQPNAQPQDVIMQLLQSEMPPEIILQIFVQLGMPQEQVELCSIKIILIQ